VILTRSEGGRFGGLWSPDGRRILYGRVNDYSIDIFAMASDGSGQRNLTRSPEGIEAFALDWAPGGATILFQRKPNGLGSPPSDIYTMRSDGTGKRNLTARPPALNDVEASWSPDGRKVLFRRSPTGSGDIYVMNANGSGKTNLTRSSAYDFAPAWSPDGTKIAFASDRGSLRNHEIFVMNADGSGQRNLTRSARNDSGPIWSPDGRRIAFTSARARVCRVPNVVGLLLSRASAVLGRANCGAGRTRFIASTQPKNEVLSQNRKPGTRLPYPGLVGLVVSSGAAAPPPASRLTPRLTRLAWSSGR
jgi:Tol biopolymer transport system component